MERTTRQLHFTVILAVWFGTVLVFTIGFIEINALDEPLARWSIGLSYAGLIGHIGVSRFLGGLQEYMNFPRRVNINGEEGVPASLVGVLERLVFAVAIGIGGITNSVFSVMAGWLALKMAANWNRAFPITSDMGRREAVVMSTRRARGALSALLAGVVSLAFAAIGGAIVFGYLDRCWLHSLSVGGN